MTTAQPTTTRRAYAYLRVSSKGQINGDGFKRQEQAIRGYASRQGIELVGIFTENGVSGTTENREALAAMMVELEESYRNEGDEKVTTVIIERLDRLARDIMVQETIIRDMSSRGIELESAHEGADLASDDPTRKLLRTFMGGIAEYDKSMTVLKLRAARERKKVATGEKCEGRKAITETAEGRDLITTVRKLRRKPRGGKRPTYAATAKALNSYGITTISGKPWTASNVQTFCSKHL